MAGILTGVKKAGEHAANKAPGICRYWNFAD
jgi:hypothetical protein